VRNGHYSNGRQRWLCRTCKRSFSWHNPVARSVREHQWFRRWIVEGYSVRQLALQSGHSRQTLSRLIWRFLSQTSPPATDPQPARHLIFDGTFLHGRRSIVALMDGKTYTVIRGRYDVPENSEPHLLTFFEPLLDQGLQPSSFTVDGNPKVIRVLRRLWPDAVIQRCLVHIQRQGLSWCRISPKTEHARELRRIFLRVTSIRTGPERDALLESVAQWEAEYGGVVQARPWRGRVIRDVKQARSMLLRALPDMFHYLEDPGIPASTNGLEGYFSRLKSRYRQHRGLSPERRSNYFDWYFRLVPR